MSIPRILHYPGSKWSMADWIISFMPPHTTYLETHFGSGAVLFTKDRSQIETVNDISKNVTNLFKVIRTRRNELIEAVTWTPHSRDEYYLSYDSSNDDLERARRLLVRLWQGRGGKTSHRTGWRSLIEPNGPQPAFEWADLPKKIIKVAERLIGVQIECQPATQLLERYRRSNVLIYADPPYIPETRTTTHYEHEMTEEEHIELLEALEMHPGPVLLSGYSHPIYEDRLKHWHRETKVVKAEGGVSRIEVLWINPVAASKIGQQLMF